MRATPRPNGRLFSLIAALCLLAFSGYFRPLQAAPQADPKAIVQTASGDLRVQRSAQPRAVALSRRSGLYTGDIVSTGANAKTTLLFEDGSQLRLNGNTTIEITDRVSVGRNKVSLFRIIKGEALARLRPGNAVQTRSAIAGVRGTVFSLNVEESLTTLTVLEGEVEFYNAFGTALVDPSERSVARYGQAPSAPVTIQNPGLTMEWTLDLDRAFIPREKFFIDLDPKIVTAALQQRRQAVEKSPSDAELRVQLGDALFDSRRYAEALTEYRAAHGLTAGWNKPLARMGDTLLEQDQLDQAEEFFRRALETRQSAPALRPASWTASPRNAAQSAEQNAESREDALIGLTWVALKRNRATEAAGTAEKAVVANNQAARATLTALGSAPGDEGGAYIARGLSLMRQPNRYDEAVKAFEEATESEPAPLRYQARAWLAMLHLSRDDSQKALREAREASRLQPHSALAHGNLSLVLFFSGEPRAAQRAAQSAIDIDPESVAARCALGQALLAQGNVDAASREAAHAVALDPEQPQARYLLGICDASRRDYSHAVVQLKESVDMAPDFLPAVTALARVYTATGRKEQAVEVLSDLLPRGRNADGVHAALGLVRYEQGNYSGAADEYRRALKMKPASAQYHSELARTLLYGNQLNAAIEAAQQSVALAPNVGQYHAILGMALDYSGLKSQSERELREALLLDPGNALALTQLAYRHVGSDLRPAAASYAQGFLRDPAVSAQLLRGGVQTEITPATGSRDAKNYGFVRRLDAADGKLRALGFLNRNGDSGDRTNDRSRQNDLGSYVTYQASPHTNLFLNLRRVRERQGLSGLDSNPDDDDNAAFRYGQAQIAVRHRLGERNALWVGLFSNTSRHTTLDPQQDSFFDAGTGLSVTRQQFDSHGLMPELRLDVALNDAASRPNVLTFGVAQSRTSFRQDRDLLSGALGLTGQGRWRQDDKSLMGYAQWERRLNDKFGFVAQLRAQRINETSDTLTTLSNGLSGQLNDSRNRTHVLPSLMATYRADKRTNLRLTTGRRHTDATASTFAPVETLLATERSSSPFGTPETQNTLQLDVERNVSRKTFVKLWVFSNSARNVQIGGSDLLGFGSGLSGADAPLVRVGSWQGKGAGMRLEHQLGRRLFANLGLITRETSNRSMGALFPAVWNGGEAPYEPSRLGNLDLNYIDPKGNKVGLRLRHVGSFFADSPLALGRPRFGAQNYVDLRLAKEPSVSREFFVQLTNVFDQPEIDFRDFSKGGRRLEFGMTQRF